MGILKRSKIILSGSVLEYFNYYGEDYSKPLLNDIEVEDKRVRSLRRARASVRRSINSNAGQWYDETSKKFYLPLFLTLTFAENIKEVAKANAEFHRFIKRFNYSLFSSRKSVLKYTAVVEFQKRGAVHYHVLLYNVPFIPDLPKLLYSIWGQGAFGQGVDIKSIVEVYNVGAYVVKYMTKDTSDDRLNGKKTYFQSRGLLKPMVVTDDFHIARILDDVPDTLLTHQNFGDVEYSKFYVGNSILRYLNTSRKYPVPLEVYIKQGILPLDISNEGSIMEEDFKGRDINNK